MKTLKDLMTALLALGFLWLGLPRCTEVTLLSKEEQAEVKRLCQMVEREEAVVAKPERLSAKEWRLVIGRYRRTEEEDLQTLENNPQAFEDHTAALLRDLAQRMKE